MPDSALDPGSFFEFDLAHGSVRARHGERVLVLTEDVLSPLIKTAVANGDLTAIRALGNQLGTAVAEALGGDVMACSPERVIAHAATMMSLYGWGRLRLERWGPALALHVEGLPPLDEDNLAVAALLGGLFSSACNVEVACVPLSDSPRYLMVDPSIAEHVWAWSKGGDGLASIVERLQPGAQ